MPAWIGIDFSGNHLKWRSRCRRSNVWVARLDGDADRLVLVDLRTVQDLPGDHAPFDRLVRLLRAGEYHAVGIDAPFSVPASYAPASYATLLDTVGRCPLGARPFPLASDFVAVVAPGLPPQGQKAFRVTEKRWLSRGVNTRSTLWAGPRGGAAMTVACLFLLYRTGKPIWPWLPADGGGCLVEAFPAAQLRTWGLPHQQYNGQERQHRENRKRIVAVMERRVEMGSFREVVIGSADALDAVVAAFAGIAVKERQLADKPVAESAREGWIAVHR